MLTPSGPPQPPAGCASATAALGEPDAAFATCHTSPKAVLRDASAATKSTPPSVTATPKGEKLGTPLGAAMTVATTTAAALEAVTQST